MQAIMNKVIWSEGMFIRPQHFQQQERYIHALLAHQPNALAPYDYGFRELSINYEQLDQGIVSLFSARGVFSDGTVFSIPNQDCAPPLLTIPEGIKKTRVYLCVPLSQIGKSEVGRDQSFEGRYLAMTDSLLDSTAATQELADIEIGKLQLRLLLEDDDRSDYSYLPILSINEMRPDKKIIYDNNFIPPLLEAKVDQRLSQFIGEVHGLLMHRADLLANRLTNTQQSESAVVADFMLLQLVNRFEVIFNQLIHTSMLHPQKLYDLCLQLMAELATFTTDTRRPNKQAAYDHNELNTIFTPLMQGLRQGLSTVLEQHAVAIKLEPQSHGIYVGQFTDNFMFENSMVVLAVYADMSPEEIRKICSMQMKIGSLEIIKDLVSRGIQGVPLVPLPIAPRQIPYHANFAYFQLDQSNTLWAQIAKANSIALHVGGNFPNLRLELWVIRG